MDHNENIYTDPLGKMLADPEGLAMKEAIYDFTEEKLGATFFRGFRPIDGLWVTQDIDISNACVMPVGYGVGDHRLFVIDIPLICLVGEDPIKVVPASARRLNCRLPYCEENYINDLEGNITNIGLSNDSRKLIPCHQHLRKWLRRSSRLIRKANST